MVEVTASSNAKIATRDFMQHQGNMTSPKEQNNLPVTNSLKMEICNFLDEEFKIQSTLEQHRGEGHRPSVQEKIRV